MVPPSSNVSSCKAIEGVHVTSEIVRVVFAGSRLSATNQIRRTFKIQPRHLFTVLSPEKPKLCPFIYDPRTSNCRLFQLGANERATSQTRFIPSPIFLHPKASKRRRRQRESPDVLGRHPQCLYTSTCRRGNAACSILPRSRVLCSQTSVAFQPHIVPLFRSRSGSYLPAIYCVI